jgi:hypothetical protein
MSSLSSNYLLNFLGVKNRYSILQYWNVYGYGVTVLSRSDAYRSEAMSPVGSSAVRVYRQRTMSGGYRVRVLRVRGHLQH